MKILKFFGNLGSTLGLGGMNRFGPEPRSSSFMNAMKGIGSAIGSGGATAAGMGGIDSEYAALIAQQLETQKQMQLVSFISNNEKSKHETQMAAIRNIRVG
jgi:hypothetical protein